MKVNVIKEFFDGRVYIPGNEFEADENRIAELEAGGYVKRVDEPKPAPKRARKTVKE